MVSKVTIGTPLSQKIVVTSAPKNRITVNNQGIGGGNLFKKLRQLEDVDATHLVDGETVVYEAEQDKFVVETLPNLDGGEF